MNLHFQVNSETYDVTIAPGERLSEVLRRRLGLKGTKIGCDAGDCGSCSVLLNGHLVCACLTAAAQAEHAEIQTVEGLAESGNLSDLQHSFINHGASQCGICTPGMLMAAQNLLNHTSNPTRVDIEDALGGVLCRCTGYVKIIAAVAACAAMRQNGGTLDDVPHVAIGQNVGAAIPHLDGRPKVSGTLHYGADSIPDDAWILRVLRSPFHHAQFTFGDLDEFVAAHPGIRAVFSAEDIPGVNCFGVIPPFADQPVFAEKVARFRGEAVAVIVGESEALAALDVRDFPIEWQEFEPLLTPQDAMRAGVGLLHEARAGNILTQGHVARGDVEEALAKCQHRIHHSITTPFIEHAYIEPEAGWAKRVGNRMIIYGCTQAAYMDRDGLAAILKLDKKDVRVVPTACGGGFGSKLDLSMQPYIALAAWHLNETVGVIYDRGESMQSTTKRHPSEITLEVGCDAEGRIQAMDFSGIFNTGAYASWGPTVANRVPVHASGPYYIPHYRARSQAVHTHTVPAGAFRGFGVPQAAIAQDCAFDKLADEAGIDRLEFRILNALTNGQPTVTGQVFANAVGITDCLEALRIPYQDACARAKNFNAQAPSHDRVLRKGVGLGSCWYGCGNTSLPNPSSIRIGITADGAVVLHQGAMDIGQGANTVIAQIAADALGIAPQQFKIIGGDTGLTPDAGKTSASRQTFVSGNAAKLAGEHLRAQLLRHANVSAQSVLQFHSGALVLRDADNQTRIDLRVMTEDADGYVFRAEETYDPPTMPLDENGQGAPYAVYGYGAQMMELTVDVGLGTVALDKLTAAHDVGRAINPLLVEGQIEGGAVQGIGMALMEEFVSGRTENLHDYLIPTIGDIPQFENIIIEVADEEGPYGAKGLGEHVLIPTAPAILNAIRDAIGVSITDLPATPDKIYAALRQRRLTDE